MNFIALAVPAFFVLIGLELMAGRISGKKLYRLNDAITNISCGIGNQVVGVFFGLITFWGYTYIYEHLRFFTISSTPFNWFILFMGVDLAYYWFHRLSHKINFIWATHIVHHQSEDYNLSVALRQSWFQALFSWWFYIPLAILGYSPFMILSVAAINTLYQFWIHTQMIKKLPAIIEFIFNTPSHHRVHHGVNPHYIDKNHAGSLIIWDRIFGTFQKEEETVVYGITSPLKSFNPFWANFHYWKELVDDATKTRTLKDKFRLFIMTPGWKPSYLGGFQGAPKVNPKQVQKFSLPLTAIQKIYILIHFTILLGLSSLFLFSSNEMIKSGNPQLLLQAFCMSVFILFSLYVFALLFESKKTIFISELSRLLMGIGMSLLFIHESFFIWMMSFSIFISLISVFLLLRFKSLNNLKT